MCEQRMFAHIAGDTDPQAQALHLYMLLLLTWLDGYSPAVRACLSLQPLVPVLVICIKARSVQAVLLIVIPAVNVVLARPIVCKNYTSICLLTNDMHDGTGLL